MDLGYKNWREKEDFRVIATVVTSCLILVRKLVQIKNTVSGKTTIGIWNNAIINLLTYYSG